MVSRLQNFGLVRKAKGEAALEALPMPHVPDDYLLVRTVCIALNPTDWTTLDAEGADGTIVGCDYAGYVEEVGSAVRKAFKKGDRVAGFSHGANDARPESGAFARFIIVKGDIQIRIPDNVAFEAATTVGVGVATTGYGLYRVLGLPLPSVQQKGQPNEDQNRETILVYGGSTATGTLAVQFAKLSGYRVLTTCSPKHFELLQSRGADEVFDYRDPDVGAKIHSSTRNSLSLVFDTVSLSGTAEICASAIGTSGGVYCNLLGIECPRADVKAIFFLGYSMSGESYIFENEHYDASPADFEFALKFVELAEVLWGEGKVVPHPQSLRGGGLREVSKGLQEGRDGKISGVKVVYRVDETEWPGV